jgi:hypothetical protein
LPTAANVRSKSLVSVQLVPPLARPVVIVIAHLHRCCPPGTSEENVPCERESDLRR